MPDVACTETRDSYHDSLEGLTFALLQNAVLLLRII